MNVRQKNDLPSEGLDIETLMEALFYRDEFLSIASHELKTPLTSIRLQAQIFKRLSKTDSSLYSKEKVDRMLNQIEAQTSRMMNLIEDMLDISRLRSGQLKMTKSTFNLSETITETVKKFPEINIQSSIQEAVIFFGDGDRIKQVLIKVLDNAVKYGNGLPIEVKLVGKKNKITLSVQDFGQGISEVDQKQIFHRFQRAVAASGVSGLGLGLYIAREIIEAHGGKISVKSVLGQGSVFYIDLKRVENV